MSGTGAFGNILTQFIEKIERLEQDRAEISSNIKAIFDEAKAAGYDTKAMRVVMKDRRLNKQQREELEALIDTYRHAVGII